MANLGQLLADSDPGLRADSTSGLPPAATVARDGAFRGWLSPPGRLLLVEVTFVEPSAR